MNIFNQHTETSAELLIYDVVGRDWFGEGVSASAFKAALDDLGDVETITVRINSEGGDVFDGMAIYNLLAEHHAEIDVIVDGLAASIASVVAMAGDTIRMAEGSMMMIHNPWSMIAGDATEFRKMAAVLDKLQDNIGSVYADRSGASIADVSLMMDLESWLTADEAIAVGLADETTRKLAVAASVRHGKYRNTPEHMLCRRPRPNMAASRSRELMLTAARLKH